MRRHTRLDPDQQGDAFASCLPAAAGKLLTQDNRSLLILADQCNVFLPVSMPIVLQRRRSSFVTWQHAPRALKPYLIGQEHDRSIPFSKFPAAVDPL